MRTKHLVLIGLLGLAFHVSGVASENPIQPEAAVARVENEEINALKKQIAELQKQIEKNKAEIKALEAQLKTSEKSHEEITLETAERTTF